MSNEFIQRAVISSIVAFLAILFLGLGKIIEWLAYAGVQLSGIIIISVILGFGMTILTEFIKKILQIAYDKTVKK